MTDGGLNRVLVGSSTTRKDSHGKLYVKYLGEVHQEHVKFFEGQDIMFRLERENCFVKRGL